MCRLGKCCKTGGCCATGCCSGCPNWCQCDVLQCVCCKLYLPQRWFGTIISLLIISFSYCMRVCTHLTIVRIVVAPNYTQYDSGCKRAEATKQSQMTYGNNRWSEQIQGAILSSFYIGYLIMHLPAGYMTDRFGARYVLTTGFLISIVSTVIMPVSIDYIGYGGMIFLRIIQGFGQGVCYPASTSYLARWVPKHERSITGSISFSGSCVGAIMGILISGNIMAAVDSWQVIYYFWGICSAIVYLVSVTYVYSDPHTHPNITERELTFLNAHLVKQIRKEVPYCAILKDWAIWATIICQFGNDYLIYLISNNMPKYLDNVLKYDVQNNALFSSLPYIAQLVSSLIVGRLADWGMKRYHWDIGCTRKVLTTIATILPGVCLLCIGFVGCRGHIAIPLFTLSMFLKGPIFAGLKVNTMDLTVQYSGICMALANGVGAIAGILVSQMCSNLAPNNTLLEWRIVFYTVFAMTAFTNIFYLAFASGKRRRWDYPADQRAYFTGNVKIIGLCDGIDQDRLDVEEGLRLKAAEEGANKQETKT